MVTKHCTDLPVLRSCFPLAIHFTFGSVYMSMLLSHFVPASPDFFFFFDVDYFFKVFIEFVTILLLFYVLVFWPQGMWDLSSSTWDWTHTHCIGRQSINHWTTREVPDSFLVCFLSFPLSVLAAAAVTSTWHSGWAHSHFNKEGSELLCDFW